MACDGVRPVFEHVERLADGATDVLSCGAANRRQCQNDGHENGPKRRAPEPSHPYSPKCHVCVPSPCRAGGSLPVGRRAAQSYVVRVLQSHFFAGARAAPPSARAARKSIRPRAQRAAYGVAYPRSGAMILLHFWRVWRRAPCCTRCWRRGSRAACTGRTPARCTASRGPLEAADGRTRDGLDFHKPQGRPIGLSSRLWGFLGTGKRFRLVSTRFSAVLRVFVFIFSFQVGLHEWRQVHGCGAC